MNKPCHFAEALTHVIQQIGLTPEEFAREAGLSIFELTHYLTGEPLPDQNYAKIFGYFLADPERSRFAMALARGCLVGSLIDGGLDLESASHLSSITIRDAAVARLFAGLSPLELLALAEIGRAVATFPERRDDMLCIAELSRSDLEDKTIPPGFFEQHLCATYTNSLNTTKNTDSARVQQVAVATTGGSANQL